MTPEDIDSNDKDIRSNETQSSKPDAIKIILPSSDKKSRSLLETDRQSLIKFESDIDQNTNRNRTSFNENDQSAVARTASSEQLVSQILLPSTQQM